MALEDIIKDIAVEGKGIVGLYNIYLNTQKINDETAKKTAEKIKKEILERLKIYVLARDYVENVLFNGNSEERQTMLELLKVREKEVIQANKPSKFAYDAYKKAIEKLPKAENEDASKSYNWTSLDEEAQKYVKKALSGESIEYYLTKYVGYNRQKTELVQRGIDEEIINKEIENAEKEIKARIDAYLSDWGDESKKFIIDSLKNKNGILLNYLLAIEQEIITYAKETMPDKDKKEIGEEIINNNFKALGYASA